MPVANPDGYDTTFQGGDFRYVRKNLRDTGGDATFEHGEGVDLNRSFAEKWGYDNLGFGLEKPSRQGSGKVAI